MYYGCGKGFPFRRANAINLKQNVCFCSFPDILSIVIIVGLIFLLLVKLYTACRDLCSSLQKEKDASWVNLTNRKVIGTFFCSYWSWWNNTFFSNVVWHFFRTISLHECLKIDLIFVFDWLYCLVINKREKRDYLDVMDLSSRWDRFFFL